MKIDKYDRQVRIWGTKGQKKLTFARVAVLGCSGPSIEAAKNLILPGIGRVDIFDDQFIRVQDLSTSFFYQHQSVGKLRGQQISKNLLEMNPDVQGDFKNISIQQILQSPQKYLNTYNLIICGNLLEQQNKLLSQECWKMQIPVIFITSVGFFFHIRSQKQLHIVESQNIASKKYYMRLHDPFEGLQNYCNDKNLPQLIAQLKQNKQNGEAFKKLQDSFGKITYPVFLIEAFKEIKKSTGKQPKSQQIKEILAQWKQLVSEESDSRDGVNEAITRSFDLFQSTQNFMPDMCLFQQQNIKSATSQSPFVYIFLKSVKQFMNRTNNHLPQIVRLPDINTSTKDYLQLKLIYKLQHQKHKNQIMQIITDMFPKYVIDEELLSEYINNIDALQIIKMRKYALQLQSPDVMGSCINYLQDQKNLLLAIRAYKVFEQHSKRGPNTNGFDEMMRICTQLSKKWQIQDFDEKFIRQICRYEGQSLISYDSIAGSIAGQQSVKLITNCFKPMNNGYFFDGLKCKGYSIAL